MSVAAPISLPDEHSHEPANESRQAGRFRPVRSTALVGLQCLRCQHVYPLSLANDPCEACKADGVHVGLAASYGAGLPGDAIGPSHFPYAKFFTLGEGNTPLLASAELAGWAGVGRLNIKDESRNPTGSHKDRMSALGVTQALDFCAHTIVLASSGNAAVSAAHYARAAGLACEVATYDAMPAAYAVKLKASGAKRHSFADNAGRWNFVRERACTPGFFALTNYHLPALGSSPLAIEGYKRIAHECHAQGGLPEHIFIPTARGDLAWGIYAGFRDMLQAGLIQKLPKLWVVEPFARLTHVLAGAPLHGSYAGHTDQFSTAGATVTYLQWQATTATGGGAVVVTDSAAREARRQMTRADISAELCAAAGLAAVRQLRDSGTLASSASVLLILTASAADDPTWPDLV